MLIKILNSYVNQVVKVNTDTLKSEFHRLKKMQDLYLKTKSSVVLFREEVVWTQVLGVGMGQEKAGVEVGLTVVVEGLWAARAAEPLLPVPRLEGLPQDPIHSVWLSVPSL